MGREISSPKRRKVSEIDGWWREHRVTLSTPEREWIMADSFDNAGFSKRLRRHLKTKFDKPTPIQGAAWPLVFSDRRDVICIAKTGSGKTLAFVAPFLALSEKGKLDVFEAGKTPRMLTLAPTRELAVQIHEVCKEFAAVCKGEYPAQVILGGIPKREQQIRIKSEGCDICTATPGRLMDLCNEGTLDLSYAQFLVLDEADRLLDMGFVDEVKRIIALTPDERQTTLFSATWLQSVHRFAISITKNAVLVNVGQDEEDGAPTLTLNDRIQQTVKVLADGRQKSTLLTSSLNAHWGEKIIIFALYKKEVARLEEWLNAGGFSCRAIQGDMTQERRSQAMNDFKGGKTKILVATDVASRGLDIPDVDLVINYTFPLTIEDFVHRCGRTGRGGKSGAALTFLNEAGDHKEKEHAFDICRLLVAAKQPIPKELEELSKNTFSATKKKDHPVYGKFFKSEVEMAKLEAKKVHTTFNDSDDE